jgi:hypothetical protein
MARTAIAVLQPVWGCRWSRPGHRLSGVAAALQPESPWVCVREGDRRNVSEETCETCSYWEPEPTAATIGRTALAAHGPVVGSTATFDPATVAGILHVSVRLLLGAIAIALFAIGFSILTSPLAIPVTVTFWLSAAAFVALAVWWRFPGD